MDGKRVVTAIALTLIVAWIVLAASLAVYVIVAASLAAMGLWEFLTIAGRKSAGLSRVIAWWVGMAFVASALWSGGQVSSPDAIVLAVGVIVLFGLQLMRPLNRASLLGIALGLTGALYVGWLFGFIIRLKLLPNGTAWVALLLLTAKAGDVGAYLVGTRWGRHRLLPRVSPNKSVEGALGGLAFSVVGAVVVQRVGWVDSLPEAVVLGVLLGALAQLGDLVESMIKRDYGVKDSGSLFPGLGGALDLIDSLLFTAPVLYTYVVLVHGVAS